MTLFWRISTGILLVRFCDALMIQGPSTLGHRMKKSGALFEKPKEVSSFEDTDASSKGLVASLTNLVNFFAPKPSKEDVVVVSSPPKSPSELMDRISLDYTEKNYLWTGDIDLGCFSENCRFTDPTISFEGRDTFVSNMQSLRAIVDALTEPGQCRSDLFEIRVQDDYVESRWNMVGYISKLPWRPRIDVVGRTKFWFRPSDDASLQIYFYDECWEMPAAKALLQLITPAAWTDFEQS